MAWQPIETAPKDGTVIDLWIPVLNASEVADCRYANAIWCDVYGWVDLWSSEPLADIYIDKPTHWMPLPEGPQ